MSLEWPYLSQFFLYISAFWNVGISFTDKMCYAGSTQNLLDPTKLMTLQDDARCRRISSEVMKRCLYKSDAPCRRRAYGRMYSSSARARMVQSMPVTPAQSHSVSPAHSPTNMTGSLYAFLSRGTTPRAVTPETEDGEEEDEECDAGIASVLRPQPRYVRALPPRLDEVADETDDTASDAVKTSAFGTSARPSYRFRSLNMASTPNALS